MAQKVVLILSLLGVLSLGWMLFWAPSPAAGIIDAAFLLSLAIFLGSVIAECRGSIARSTEFRNQNPGSPHDAFHADRKRFNDSRNTTNSDTTDPDATASASSRNPAEIRTINRAVW